MSPPLANRPPRPPKLLNNLRDKSRGRSNSVSIGSGIGSWGTTRPRTSLLRPRSESVANVGAVNPGKAAQQQQYSGYGSHKQARNYAFSLQQRGGLPDIDASDRNNPLMVTEIVNDIYSFYRNAEPEFSVPSDYMSKQSDINDRMRAILIDWLVEVHLKFKLIPETLFLAHNLIDRFLSKKNVMRKNLQLVGVTAMLIASKYEEIYAPEVRDFVYISDKAYNRDQILGMEKLMLNTLKFTLTVPTAFHFMSRYLKAAGADKQMELMSAFLVELSLSDYSLVKYPASQIAAAAVYAGMKTLRRGGLVAPNGTGSAGGAEKCWTFALEKHSGYAEAEVRPVAAALVRSHARAAGGTASAVYKKYSHSKFQEVARTSPASSLLNE